MTILTGYVPSPEGEASLEAAIEEARLRGLELVILNATGPGGTADQNFADDETAARLRSRLDDSGVTYRLLRSSSPKEPADEIVSTAQELDAELIVIGVRQRSPVGKLLMGSTAQRILLDARCPVLAVKPRPAAIS